MACSKSLIMTLCLALTGLLIFQIGPGHCQPNPCEDYELIDMHEGRRERTYQTEPDGELYCDDDVDPGAWVRFRRDGLSYRVTTETCLPVNHCGLSTPLWIDSRYDHPTNFKDEVRVKICSRYVPEYPCCESVGHAFIRLCHNKTGEPFYVYKLPKLNACFSGYCVDPESGSCEPKFKRDPNRKCIPYFPPQNRPTLEGPIIHGTAIEFYCAVAYTGPKDKALDARFHVTFNFDGFPDPRMPVATVNAGGKALLDERFLQGNFGTHAENSRIDVSEADELPKEVVLRATLPVLCKDPKQPCRACTRVVTEGMTSTGKQCEYCFDQSDWNYVDMKAYSDFPLKISALKSPRWDVPAVYYINFKPFTYKYETSRACASRKDTLWTGYTMDNIQVTYKDMPYGLCSATGDPHITSFDGKYFHVYLLGQFLMWKSEASRHVEVHVRLWRCRPGSQVSCICAVAVREGNAILGVDMCGSRSSNSVGRIKILRYSPPSWTIPEEAFISSDGGLNHYINMPSGTYVRVQTGKEWGLNIYIHGLPEDRFKSSGLCGNFDNNTNNDLIPKGSRIPTIANDNKILIPVKFSESYRIERSASFFDSTPQWVKVADPDISKCHCHNGTIDCSPTPDVKGGKGIDDKCETLQKADKARTYSRRRGKRDVHAYNRSDNIDDDEDNFDYGENFQTATEFLWPTPSGLTESQARDFCQDTFDELEYKDDCLAKTNVDLEKSIQSCMEDIKITDNKTWAQASVGSFEESCSFLYLQDRGLYTEGPEGELRPPLKLLGKICPNQCSRRGRCSDGICNCNKGFTGLDCSLEEGVPPELHYIPGTGRCDLTQRPCKEFRLIGSRFRKSDKLTCRVAELSSKATANDLPVNHDSTIIKVSEGTAKFVTVAEISCKVPDITSQDMAYYQLMFDFSFDGENYSNRVMVTVVNGGCLECDNGCEKAENWKMLSDSCLIDERCAIAGDMYTTDRCFTCDPDQSWDSWTEVPVDRCGLASENSKVYLIVGAASGGVIGLLLICIAIAFVCLRKIHAPEGSTTDTDGYLTPRPLDPGEEGYYEEINDATLEPNLLTGSGFYEKICKKC